MYYAAPHLPANDPVSITTTNTKSPKDTALQSLGHSSIPRQALVTVNLSHKREPHLISMFVHHLQLKWGHLTHDLHFWKIKSARSLGNVWALSRCLVSSYFAFLPRVLVIARYAPLYGKFSGPCFFSPLCLCLCFCLSLYIFPSLIFAVSKTEVLAP